ncbi:MAG: diguanylate cyclase [Armatimonadia bacterium]
MSAVAVSLINCPPDLDKPLRLALLRHDLLPADQPHLPAEVIILWLDRLDTAADTVQSLRAAQRHPLPAILGVAPVADAPALAVAATVGLDALTTSADPGELAAHARLLASSRQRFAEASPLMGLPGNNALQREIERRLPLRGQLAVLAFDVDFFKSYNDRYGYARGDGMLSLVGSAMLQALSSLASPGWFAAHLGGDDFFAVVHPREAEAVARRAIEVFEAGLPSLYDPEDWHRQTIIVRNRRGKVVEHPIVSLTVAAVTNEADDLTHPGQFAAVLAELKNYAKSLQGSNYVPDRRRTHDVTRALSLKPSQQSPSADGPGGS